MTTPDDPNAQGWNAPPPVQPPAEGQAPAPYAPQYGQPAQPPQPTYGQPPAYGQQPGAYPQMGYPAASMDTGIPGSVKTVSVLSFIAGGFSLLAGLLAFTASAATTALGSSAVTGLTAFLGVLLLAFGALYIILGIKIRTGANWARITGLVLAGLSVLNGLASLGGSRSGGSGIVGLALAGLIIYFLAFEPKAKVFFAAHKG